MRTMAFASLAYENKKKKTRRERFLEEMDRVIPWQELTQIIKEPVDEFARLHNPSVGGGCGMTAGNGTGYISDANPPQPQN